MTTEADKAVHDILKKEFTDRQIIALDYVARCAAREAIETHSQSCPFQREVYSLAGKIALGSVVVLGTIGGVIWTAIKVTK